MAVHFKGTAWDSTNNEIGTDVQIGGFSSLSAGVGQPINASRTKTLDVCSDDAGVALAAGDYRSARNRMLLTASITANVSVSGTLGQLKVANGASIAGANKAGITGYLEVSDRSTIAATGDAIACGVRGRLDVTSGCTIAVNSYVASFAAGYDDLSGTHTGKAVVLDVRTPQAGTFDALMHLESDTGATGTTYGAIDANKCLLVYYNDTLMKIPLYAAA